jgi:hypothetical protein
VTGPILCLMGALLSLVHGHRAHDVVGRAAFHQRDVEGLL